MCCVCSYACAGDGGGRYRGRRGSYHTVLTPTLPQLAWHTSCTQTHPTHSAPATLSVSHAGRMGWLSTLSTNNTLAPTTPHHLCSSFSAAAAAAAPHVNTRLAHPHAHTHTHTPSNTQVIERLQHFAPVDVGGEDVPRGPIHQQAVELAEAAASPKTLCRMDPTWHPWF